MNIKLIKTEEDYQKALARLDVIFDAPLDSPEGDEADILSILIEKYEDEHYPIGPPDPIEAIKFRMEQLGMKKSDLAEILGYKSRVSENTPQTPIFFPFTCWVGYCSPRAVS